MDVVLCFTVRMTKKGIDWRSNYRTREIRESYAQDAGHHMIRSLRPYTGFKHPEQARFEPAADIL